MIVACFAIGNHIFLAAKNIFEKGKVFDEQPL